MRLGLEALALTDHDGFYGVVRFAEAASRARPADGVRRRAVTGSTKPQNGEADPEGHHLSCSPVTLAGYARLSRVMATAQLARQGEGQAAATTWSELTSLHGDQWLVLTGCRKGAVPAALMQHGPAAAARQLQTLVDGFGRDNVVVELWDHGDPLDSARNDALGRDRRARAGIECVATNNVHYATPARRPLATALAAVRARRSLDEIDGWLPGGAGAHLRSGAEQARRFARYPGVVERAGELAPGLRVRPRLVAPEPAAVPVPDGPRRDVVPAAAHRGGRDATATARGTPSGSRARGRRSTTSSQLIETLGFPGYFLIVWDIVAFCRRPNIFCQGRGSAANSAVCYALGITNADAVQLGLLFERFLSPERDGPPDIDIDIESDRREEAIQYVYERYGRTTRGAGGQRHHVPGQVVGARHGQGARLRHRPAGRVVEADRRVGSAWPRRRRLGDHDIPPAGARRWPRRSSTSRATSASTRAAW